MYAIYMLAYVACRISYNYSQPVILVIYERDHTRLGLTSSEAHWPHVPTSTKSPMSQNQEKVYYCLQILHVSHVKTSLSPHTDEQHYELKASRLTPHDLKSHANLSDGAVLSQRYSPADWACQLIGSDQAPVSISDNTFYLKISQTF